MESEIALPSLLIPSLNQLSPVHTLTLNFFLNKFQTSYLFSHSLGHFKGSVQDRRPL
jgi:hypothetical protein